MDIIHDIYKRVYKYIFDPQIFNNPSRLDITTLSYNDKLSFNNFKTDPEEFNKMIFALNNIPDKIFDLLFQNNNDICPKFYKLVFIMDPKLNTYVNTFSNLYDLKEYIDNQYTRYIYIKVDIIDKTLKINHVNCIIIDKLEKYILVFEPKYKLMIDINKINDIFTQYIDINEYKLLTPTNIGYNSLNRLQRNDCFCQTYIVFIFYLIIENSHITYPDFSKLFNTVITTENIGYFIWYIYQKFVDSDLEINDIPILWHYPSNNFKSLLNSIILSTQNTINHSDYEDTLIESMDEDEDILIINYKNN
jgi:hypothetical protein